MSCSNSSSVSGDKYELKSVEKSLYQISMILIIRYIQKHDFQNYRCVAKNSLGEVDGVISLDGKLHQYIFMTWFVFTAVETWHLLRQMLCHCYNQSCSRSRFTRPAGLWRSLLLSRLWPFPTEEPAPTTYSTVKLNQHIFTSPAGRLTLPNQGGPLCSVWIEV